MSIDNNFKKVALLSECADRLNKIIDILRNPILELKDEEKDLVVDLVKIKMRLCDDAKEELKIIKEKYDLKLEEIYEKESRRLPGDHC